MQFIVILQCFGDMTNLGTCKASRFNSNSNRPSDSIRFESDWPIRKFRIESSVPAPLLITSLVKRLKPLMSLSGTVYRLASSMSDQSYAGSLMCLRIVMRNM